MSSIEITNIAKDHLNIALKGIFVNPESGTLNDILNWDPNIVDYISVDMSDLKAINSWGMAALISLKKKTQKNGITLEIFDPSPEVMDVLIILKVDCLFNIVQSDLVA